MHGCCWYPPIAVCDDTNGGVGHFPGTHRCLWLPEVPGTVCVVVVMQHVDANSLLSKETSDPPTPTELCNIDFLRKSLVSFILI